MLLAELLCGRRPAPEAPLADLPVSVPAALRTVLSRATALEPFDRYAGADDMGDDLGRAVSSREGGGTTVHRGPVDASPSPEPPGRATSGGTSAASTGRADTGTHAGMARTTTVTLLVCDVADATSLWEEAPETMATALAHHDTVVRTGRERPRQYFLATGDSHRAAFGSARSAILAAVAAQQGLLSQAWPDELRLSARMGLHTGACTEFEGVYVGPTVSRTARLEAIAHGGQIVASGVTADEFRRFNSEGISLRDLGQHRLKDLGEPESVWQVEAPQLRIDFPPLDSLENPRYRHNLPARFSSFVGRTDELAHLRDLLQRCRLVTLTGAGGTGKTRLALQAAADSVDGTAEGVWFVDLAPVGEPELVAAAVATVLSIRDEPGRPLAEVLCEQLGDRGMLLVLDNCEHLVGACAKLGDAILSRCPGVVLLVTSRQPLGIDGEHVFRIPPLSLPEASDSTIARDPLDMAARSDAVTLFCERAYQHRPEFRLGVDTVQAVVSLCRKLDGLPLAIELASARLGSLSVGEIDARLDDHLRMLTAGTTTALPRQRTVRALIDWSFDLLSPPEKATLARLSVFAGGWSIEAAEAVCGDGDLEAFDLLELLTSLVDKSLVVAESGASTTATACSRPSVSTQPRSWSTRGTPNSSVPGTGTPTSSWPSPKGRPRT